MWRKFLCEPGLRFSSGSDLSTLKFATPDWVGKTLEERRDANRALWESLQDASRTSKLRKSARVLFARSIRRGHLPGLILSDPLRYLPMFWLRLLSRKPQPLQL